MTVRLLSVLAAAILQVAPIHAAECPAGRGEQIMEVLESMPSCEGAYRVFEACSYGSSMDVQFGAVVVSKCEGEFLMKLAQWRRKIYDQKQGACSRKYRNRQGSMYQSFEAFCHADVARRYARSLGPRQAQNK